MDHLFQQSFWYRVGNASAELGLTTLPNPVEGTTDTNFDGDQDTLFVRYEGGDFKVEVTYKLSGGSLGSGISNISEQIAITNMGVAPLDFHFFQYSDFDLLGTPGGDEAVFTNLNAVRQFEGSLALTETVVTPVPSHREIAPYDITLDKLEDGVPSNLSDTPGIGVVMGPADLTWAYQWDVSIQPNNTFIIGKQKGMEVVPEPATLLMASTILGLMWGVRRERRCR